MNCMKCGREMADEGVFCAECLEEMERYPIKPGTVVHLPRRKQEPVVKKTAPRRKSTPEEQVKSLRKLVRWLALSLTVTVLLLAVTGYYTVTHLLEDRVVFLPGQNYSAIETMAPNEN